MRTRFWYGPDGQRYKREDGSKRTLYLGNVEIVTDAGVTTVKRTVAGVVLQTMVGGSATTYYLFHDQLGSLVRIADASGGVVNVLDYLAQGGRRDPDTQLAYGGGAGAPTLTTRGFTGHEHVDGATPLIHMNARLYDPYQGRFLQPDPVIQAPDNAQSWNAYAYVFNNPLTYTDPTGMFSLRQALAVVIGVVAAVFGQYYITQGMYMAAFGVAVAGGFAAGYVATGSLKGGLQSAFTAALTFGVGLGIQNWDVIAQIGAQAVTGGVIESLQGGNFGHGFIAAGLTAAFMPQVGKIGNDVARTAVGALVGGTITKLTGGKFANGAISGAIQAAMAGGKRTQRDMQADAARSDGEWIFPDGMPTEMNAYDEVMTNGILGKRDEFVALVNHRKIPGYFNPSSSFAADVMESFGQKFFGWAGDPLAAGFAQGLAGVDHPMRIIAHSQGTLTVANAARYYGLPRGSTFVMRSPALSYFSASAAVRMNGGTMQYIQPWGDIANIYAPTMNPLKWMSGFRDVMCGACTHTANGLP